MKNIKSIIAFGVISALLLSGCSSNVQSSMGAGTSEVSVAATEEGTAEEKMESHAPSTGQSEETSEEERTESINESTAEAEKEPVVLKVCSLMAGNFGFQSGWADKMLLDQFNIKVYYVDYFAYGWDIDQICEEEPDIDIIVWPHLYFYEEHLDSGLSLEWDDALLEYGPYLKEHLKEQIDYVTERSAGKRYGFIADSTDDGRTEMETVWTIGKGSTHPEAAMTLLNWIASSEGVLTWWYGPRGICWDIDEEGYYYLTELGIQVQGGETVALPEEYNGMKISLNFGNHYLDLVCRKSTVNPDSIHGETYDWTTWKLMQDQVE